MFNLSQFVIHVKNIGWKVASATVRRRLTKLEESVLLHPPFLSNSTYNKDV